MCCAPSDCPFLTATPELNLHRSGPQRPNMDDSVAQLDTFGALPVPMLAVLDCDNAAKHIVARLNHEELEALHRTCWAARLAVERHITSLTVRRRLNSLHAAPCVTCA